jgi:mRNA-degrading endonuclease RelE of RelBE toxin-antitoxin system
MYAIRLTTDALADLRELSAYYQRILFSAIETHLTREPTVPSRRRKPLPDLPTPWEPESLTWELRVGDYRVFYDVAEVDRVVMVRAVRRKPPDKRTEEIL